MQDITKVFKYRNESQIKRYYKDIYIMQAINKVVNLYNVGTFTFQSSRKIYNRVELEEAIEKHLKSNKQK